ncbi:chromosome-associated kinesin KIF4 [Aulographum hederae CBS 113979]|uniref:Chromosome-associated kinesin KIF4 n=1 Tax=Aulographum hederae CBS 113979 TaxID=1176131 RepID=A0A6G1H8Y1_9PEZI|nr:chromosome-associated kinesin KIF4 [Aulographum hederae CBS 113979]
MPGSIMASSPPASPSPGAQRPKSVMVRPSRSGSRMSISSKMGAASRISDDDEKTAVKVAVRVRPPLKLTDPDYDLVPQRFRGSTCHVTSGSQLTVESAQGKKVFVFDRVFGEDVNQEGVWEYLSESVNSFAEGYNVSILAYGQSGAGKSYTMGTTGPSEQSDPSIMGVVPRAARALFEKLNGTRIPGSGLRTPFRYSTAGLSSLQSSRQEKNWQMKATYVEIYQEQLRDLLVPESVPQAERPPVTIREDTKGRILLTGLQEVNINSMDDLLNALNFGSSIRQTDATAVNARSSRSHAVFSINLVQKKNKSTPVMDKRRSVPLEVMSGSDSVITVDSKLHFVDLAGSERLKNTGANGERAKEGISINGGLASLGKVISQLSTRSAGSHVSYRDSKLTRLLQDSLGGNAITYMVACINPAEFHLSETLNTVQYAQRARAIQIRPQIQATHDDSDKQAAIERLRAEVSFLRDQIRLSERSNRKSVAPQGDFERPNQHEKELQNQLLDTQENYRALSQRHTKLISEITKSRDSESSSEDLPVLNEVIGGNALERLKRSSSFAESVEQVVLEYEKTIQSLEGSLSNTRSSLSNSESSLLEKETKIAYLETVTQQLQSRIQKAMDREANDENYLRDLESRVVGATSEEEKSNAVVHGLRKELARARENESSCEEYISTLEERLAEAEHDHEIMQREIDRLENVVERQRSIGKLDNLLYELDHIRRNDTPTSGKQPQTNGHGAKPSTSMRSFDESEEHADQTPDTEGGAVEEAGIDGETATSATRAMETGSAPAPDRGLEAKSPETTQSPAQSRFMADKLESVTNELFDLRMEHETTVNDYDELSRKYQVALTTLAEMQDAVDRNPRGSDSTRPTSFLQDAGVNGVGEDGQPSSSRTLSSELSSLGVSPNTLEQTDVEAADQHDIAETIVVPQKNDQLSFEVDNLRKMHAEKELTMAELTKSYGELEEKHQDTLDYVEELKAEVQKAQMHMARPSSPAGVIRRKSSQAVANSERATRSVTSLRNLTAEKFEDDPDTLQSVESSLNSIATEIQNKSERVAALEGEVAAAKKEMESKMAIISGLTRERSSMKSSAPIDMSVVSTMRDQLVESENQIRGLHESHAAREQELLGQIDQLKTSMDASPSSAMPGIFPETPALNQITSKELAVSPVDGGHQEQIFKLQKEVDEWRTKHLTSMETMKASEQQLQATIKDLETSVAHAEKTSTDRGLPVEDSEEGTDAGSAQDTIAGLRQRLEEHKTTAGASATRLAELEQSHASILSQVEEDSKSRELTEKELDTHRGLVSNLESQLSEHKSAVAVHQQTLDTLRESHAKELDEVRASLEATKSDFGKQIAVHETALSKAKDDMIKLVQGIAVALNEDLEAPKLEAAVKSLFDERKKLLSQHNEAQEILESTKKELATHQKRVAELESKNSEFEVLTGDTLKEMETIREKERKSSRLVDELEEQLNSNYDSHQAVNHRLSAMQTERQVHLEEAVQAKADIEKELEDSRNKISMLENQLAEIRRRSQRSSLDPRDSAALERASSPSTNPRKSTHATLPSPPPAIPLPPLPGSPPPGAAPSPPTSRHTSKDIAQAQLVEDQEARIRTIEKHLFAEKQLTATLEEALTDLESSSTKLKSEMDSWRRKCHSLEEELSGLKKERNLSRHSVQQLEEERNARMRIEAERANLEQRMAQLSMATKKKKSGRSINCF